jgi:hypothetical protein
MVTGVKGNRAFALAVITHPTCSLALVVRRCLDGKYF